MGVLSWIIAIGIDAGLPFRNNRGRLATARDQTGLLLQISGGPLNFESGPCTRQAASIGGPFPSPEITFFS